MKTAFKLKKTKPFGTFHPIVLGAFAKWRKYRIWMVWSFMKKWCILMELWVVQTQVPSGERKGLSRAGRTGEEKKMGKQRGSRVGMQAPVWPARPIRNNSEMYTGFLHDMLLFFFYHWQLTQTFKSPVWVGQSALVGLCFVASSAEWLWVQLCLNSCSVPSSSRCLTSSSPSLYKILCYLGCKTSLMVTPVS